MSTSEISTGYVVNNNQVVTCICGHKYVKTETQSTCPECIDEELPDGIYMKAGKLMVTCRKCEKDYEWSGTVKEFEDSEACYVVCGGSQYCLP